MPAEYVIDRERGIVFSTGTGVVTFAELSAHQERLRVDPDFDPAFRQLMDMSQVTQIATQPGDLQTLAERNVFGPGARRAIVMKGEAHFGMARSFELMRGALTERPGQEPEQIMVFRDLAEARRWLGLE